jgi:predicted ATPase/DNA-binding SARP family transcriptional activator
MALISSYPPESALHIRLFGPFAVQAAGRPLSHLHSRKGQWLLALLTLRHGSEVSRDWLAGTLWPESGQTEAFANLRNCLYDLRRALGPHAYRLGSSSSQTLRLDLSGAEADVLVFDTAVSLGEDASLAEAIRLYRGPLLEGCTEEWVLSEREAREHAYLQALEKLAARRLEQGDARQAADYLRRAVAVDPLRESAQRGLMRALGACGDYSSAVQTYRDFRLWLRQELNTEPAAETRALFEQIHREAHRRAQASAGSVPRTPPPPRSLSVPPTNLPIQPTSFIGREKEKQEVRAFLGATRLLTLTGIGGGGKTRLALQVAAEVSDAYPDGVCLVELAAVSHPALVSQTVASVLKLREKPGRVLLDILTDYLNTRILLLVLDNCEHLTAACAELTAALLRTCPSLCILATSREALNVPGELIYRVPPLSLPGLQQLPSAESLLQYEAPTLFVERARFSRPEFTLTPENASYVLRICSRLDGIPLAIELAAVRVRALPVEQIDAHLGDRFHFLTGGNRTALPKQQTLRAAMDWSYDLLTEQERLLLRRLSVFSGGWTLEAAEAVCSGEEIELNEIPDLLTTLVDKSLVVYEEEAGGESRYRLLETVRQYGQERPAERKEAETLRRRHQDWFLALAEEASRKLRGPETAAWLERLEKEHDNLRAALDWCEAQADNVEPGLRLAGALGEFWEARSYIREGRERLARAVESSRNAPASLRAPLFFRAGRLAYVHSNYWQATALYEESLALYRQLKDRERISVLLWNLGFVARFQGDYALAHSRFAEDLAISRELADKRGIAETLQQLGHLLQIQGEYGRATALLEESLALSREVKHPWGIAAALGNLGEAAFYTGDLPRAKALCEQSLYWMRENERGNTPMYAIRQAICWMLGDLARVARLEGDYARARVLLEEWLASSERTEDKFGIADALREWGILACIQGDYGQATEMLRQSLFLVREIGTKYLAADYLEAVAGLAAAQGKAERAVSLFGAAEALRKAVGEPRPPVECAAHAYYVALARAGLGEEAFAAAWAEGLAMSLEQAIDCALADEGS